MIFIHSAFNTVVKETTKHIETNNNIYVTCVQDRILNMCAVDPLALPSVIDEI